MGKVKIVQIQDLRAHEKTNKKNLEKVKSQIIKDGYLSNPIIVDKDNNIILDGHHRAEALQKIGCKKIPAFLLDYFDDGIKVLQRRSNIKVSKEIIVKRALAGKVFPYKTSKHIIPQRPKKLNISIDKLM